MPLMAAAASSLVAARGWLANPVLRSRGCISKIHVNIWCGRRLHLPNTCQHLLRTPALLATSLPARLSFHAMQTHQGTLPARVKRAYRGHRLPSATLHCRGCYVRASCFRKRSVVRRATLRHCAHNSVRGRYANVLRKRSPPQPSQNKFGTPNTSPLTRVLTS